MQVIIVLYIHNAAFIWGEAYTNNYLVKEKCTLKEINYFVQRLLKSQF